MQELPEPPSAITAQTQFFFSTYISRPFVTKAAPISKVHVDQLTRFFFGETAATPIHSLLDLWCSLPSEKSHFARILRPLEGNLMRL